MRKIKKKIDSQNYENVDLRRVRPDFHRVTELRVASRLDLKNVILDYASRAAPLTFQNPSDRSSSTHSSDVGWLQGEDDVRAVNGRLDRTFGLVRDGLRPGGSEWVQEHGQKCAIDVSIVLIENIVRSCRPEVAGGKATSEVGSEQVTELLEEVHACIGALFVLGKAQEGFDLARLVGAIACILPSLFNQGTESETLQAGTVRGISVPANRMRVLGTLMVYLDRNQIPDYKALHLEALPTMEAAQFSRLFSKMRIWRLIPASVRQGSPEGSIYDLNQMDPIARMSPVKIAGVGRRNSRIQLIEKSDAHPNLRPSYEAERADMEIQKIKDHLGGLYEFLLIRFGMEELETPEDLSKFVGHLSYIGLGFPGDASRAFSSCAAENTL